jgi:lipopolysaccharide export system protein LptA
MGSKIRASMKIISTPLLLAALALSCAPALAERADRDKPMTIDADALRHDDLKLLTVFTGKVTVTKGTILMRGARIEIRQDGQGNQFGILTPEPGERVFFRQKREGLDEFMEGEGERIEYDSATDTVRILRRGELRRLVGTKVADEISGSLIVYNNSTEVFTVDGQPGEAGRGGRVRAILAPRAPASAAAGAVTAPPARAGAPQTAPGLRSSSTLGGDKK